jgi:queuine tRNA-ribosyltransferase
MLDAKTLISNSGLCRDNLYVMFSFELIAEDGEARVGRLTTTHGSIDTPSFVSVATHGTVNTLSAHELHELGVQVIIANCLHLHLKPGEDLIEKMGGLHQFTGWEGPLMTDSGGFQVFSLGAGKRQGVAKIGPIFPGESGHESQLPLKDSRGPVRVDGDGVEFTSYVDGSRKYFTPERVIEIEGRLGADIILPLDECTSPLDDYRQTREAMRRTHDWAARSLRKFENSANKEQALFGIVQGGAFEDLREESASFFAARDFDGYAIGGSLGRSKQDMHRVLKWVIPLLPQDKTRHLLGIGEIEDIFEIVSRGIDLFDCVLPTKIARTGTLFVKEAHRFRIHILNARFRDDPLPVDERCDCPTCSKYSRAYLRHLFLTEEALAVSLATVHNVYFMESLMRQIRFAIKGRRFNALKDEWLRAKRSMNAGLGSVREKPVRA